MLCDEILVKHPHSKGQPLVIDKMLCGEVLVKHTPQLVTAR